MAAGIGPDGPGWLSGIGRFLKGLVDRTPEVELAPIQARPPDDPYGFRPPKHRLADILRRPFARDTLPRLIDAPYTFGEVKRWPRGVLAFVDPDQPSRVNMTPRAQYLPGLGGFDDAGMEALLTHELTHSADLQDDPAVVELYEALAPDWNQFADRLWADSEPPYRISDGTSYEGGEPPFVSHADPTEHLAFVVQGAMDAIRRRHTEPPEVWQERVDSMEARLPGIKRAIRWVDSRLGGGER